MKLDAIKIVIWDLDETFWNGTLSEGGIEPIEENIELVKKLVNIGVMNSISSKNDYEMAKEKLTQLGIWDYFIFPKINWEAKGQQIKQLLEECQLRAENALFLDDNAQNLSEAAFYAQGLQTAGPDQIPQLSLLKGKPDPACDRLKQYKILEEKNIVQKKFGSNEEFLQASHIKVLLKKDCENHIDRLFDLISRSNQLNYTKVRLSKEKLKKILSDERYHTGYVEVYDDYGEYGIVGFYALTGDKAEHFLFSCRTIGMGIEQYVYAQLGFPEVHTIGEVRYTLKKDVIPTWISSDLTDNSSSPNAEAAKPAKTFPHSKKPLSKTTRILVSGGCDLEQMAAYLRSSSCKIEYKFNNGPIRHDHTVYMTGIKKYTNEQKAELIRTVPFIEKLTFSDELYSGNYDIVVLSLLMDFTQAVYKNKRSGLYIAFGDFNKKIGKNFNPPLFSEDELKRFTEDYEFCGIIAPEDFIQNLEFIRNSLPNTTQLILINGCEIDVDVHPWEKDRYLVHQKYNQYIDTFLAAHNQNTFLLDMRKLVTDRSQLSDNIRHYNRTVFFSMASELSRIINEITSDNSFTSRQDHIFFWKLKKKLRSLIRGDVIARMKRKLKYRKNRISR